jgi:uncharacterized protein (TIGR02246 family)
MPWRQKLGLWSSLPGAFGSIILAACAATRPAGDEERTIRELDAAWSRALASKDLDGVMSYYADEALFLAPGSPIVKGKEQIRMRFARRMSLPGYSASFEPTSIVVARSRDMAHEVGVFRLTLDDAAGIRTTTTGKHLVTWEKRGGTWKVTAESINADHAPTPRAGEPADRTD